MSQNSVKFSIDYKYFFRISKMRFKIMSHLLKYLQCTGFDLLLKLKRTLIFFYRKKAFCLENNLETESLYDYRG